MIFLKKESEIAKMREAGRVLARTMRLTSEAIVPGKTTPLELDALAERLIVEKGGRPTFKGHHGFAHSVCISVNEAVVHGVPTDRPLRDGDVVGLDFGVTLDGWQADGAWTFPVGSISDDAQKLLDVTSESLAKGIAAFQVGSAIGDVGAAVQEHVEPAGYGVVRELVGHGIGRDLWEEPQVPNFGKPGDGPQIQEGMTVCIEPMVNEGTAEVRVLEDGWTTITADRKLSAHFEHTVAATSSGPVVLTVE